MSNPDISKRASSRRGFTSKKNFNFLFYLFVLFLLGFFTAVFLKNAQTNESTTPSEHSTTAIDTPIFERVPVIQPIEREGNRFQVERYDKENYDGSIDVKIKLHPAPGSPEFPQPIAGDGIEGLFKDGELKMVSVTGYPTPGDSAKIMVPGAGDSWTHFDGPEPIHIELLDFSRKVLKHAYNATLHKAQVQRPDRIEM